MGLLGQLGLLMRKNLKLRIRSPALTLTQLILPVLLFVFVAVIRTRFQPQSNPNCYYDAKATPSRGLVPFMQSFMCDLSTSCKSRESGVRTGNELPAYHAQAQIAQIAKSLEPIFSNSTKIESLKRLPESIKPLGDLSDGLDSESLTNFTERSYLLADFFHNASDVRRYLSEEGGLDDVVVDALLHAQLDVYQLLELTGFVDFKGIVCNTTRLSRTLSFPPDVDINGVSQALCNVQDEKISIIIDELQTQLDIPYLIDEFAQFLKALGQTDWSLLLENASTLLKQLKNIGNLGNFVEGLPNLLEIARLVPTLRELLSQFEQGTLEKQLGLVVRLAESIDAQLMNITWWTDAMNVLSKAHGVVSTITDYLTHFEDNVVPIGSLLRNKTTIHDILEQRFNITSDEIQAILQLQLNHDSISEFLQLVASTDQPAELFCSTRSLNISEFFSVPPGGIPTNIDSLQKTLCSTGTKGETLLELLLNSTDSLLLVEKVKQILNSPPSTVQWEALLDDVVALSRSIQELPEFVRGLPELLASFGQLFKQQTLPIDWVQVLAGSLSGNTTAEEAIKLWNTAELLETLDMQLGVPSPMWWTTVKDIINRGQGTLSALLEQVDRYRGHLSLASLFRNESLFRDIFENRINLSAEDVQLLRQSSIDMDKVIPLILDLATSQENPAVVFCSGQLRVIDYLIVPDNASSVTVLASSLQRALCHLGNDSSNATSFLTTLLEELDLTMLSDKIGDAVGRPLGTIDDWGLLFTKLANISNSVQTLPSFIQELPSLLKIFQQPLDFSGDWSGIISWFRDNMAFTEAMEHFGSGIYPPLVQTYLSRTEFWPAIQQQLITQNLLMDLQISIVELFTDDILIQLLTEQPFLNATRTLLGLGPNVTESVIRTFLNATKLQMLFDMNRDNQSKLLCSEGFVNLQPSDAAARPKLCRLEPWDLLHEQSAFWNVPEIETRFNRLLTFLGNPDPNLIPPEYAPYANLSDVIIKNQLIQTLVQDAVQRPFSLEALSEAAGIVVTGSEEEWLGMLSRISAMMNEEVFLQWLDIASGTNTSTIDMSLLRYIRRLVDTVLRATNQLFTIIQEFGVGQVFNGAMPETQRFLQGIMGLLDEGPALLGALAETWNDPSQYSDMLTSSDVKAIFCNDAARRSWLNRDRQSINTTSLDDYLCRVNYEVLAVELKDVVSFDDIVSQVIALQEDPSNTTMSGPTLTADLMMNIETLQRNIQTLPYTLAGLNDRYNLSSLVTMAEALFNAILMGFDNVDITNANNELDLDGIFQYVPGLKMIVDTLAVYEAIDLKQVHAYVAFMNQFLEHAKENSCREDWQKHDHSCYRYASEPTSYWAAYYGCLTPQVQSNIVTVDNTAEQMFLQSFGPNADVWVNQFLFSAYQNYAPQQPTAWGSCLKANFGDDGLWYHTNCSHLYPYICEVMPELNLTLRLLGPLTNDSSVGRIIDALEQTLGAETVNTILASPVNPFELSRLVLAADWQKAVCNASSLRALFAFPPSFSVTQLSEVLCGNAFVEMVLALSNNSLVFEQFLNKIASLQKDDFNSTSFIQDTESFLLHLASLSKYRINSYLPFTPNPFSEFTAFNELAWQHAWSVETLLGTLDAFDMGLIDEVWYRDGIKELRSVAYLTEYFTDRILLLKGKYLVFPELRNLLANITEIERLAEVVANFTPELIDSILSLVVKPDKLEEFFSFSDPLTVICSGSNFSAYFTLPVNSNTDLSILEGAVCSVDFLKVQMQFLAVFPIDSFMNEYLAYVNTSSSDRLSSISQRFIALYEKTEAFLADPFTVNINETWLDGTFTEVVQVLQIWGQNQVAMSSSDETSVLSVIERLETEFMNQSWWSEIKVPIRELTSIIDYANMKLKPLPGRNITFFDLFPPTTADLLQMLMADFPHIVGALSKSYVNITKLESLSTPGDLVDLICNNSTGATELIEFLPSVNTTAVDTLLCSLDYVLLSAEWSQEVQFFEERRNLPLNWTSSYASVLSFVQTLTDLSQSPPELETYDADWFTEKLRETEAILTMLLPVNSELSGAELDNLFLTLDTFLAGRGEYYNGFIMQFRLEDYINRFLIDQLSMFTGQNWTLPMLEGLFVDAGNVRSLLALWDLTPDIVDAFLSLSIRPQMWSSFWETPDPFATLCSTNQFASFFELPASSQSNLTAVKQAVCSVNFTLIPLELSQYYNLSKIQMDLKRIFTNDPSLEPFSWSTWMTNRNRLSEVIGELVLAPPRFEVDAAWWNATQSQLLNVLNSWSMNVQQMTLENPTNSSQELLQGLEATLQSLGAWDAIRPYLEIFTLSLEGAAKQLREQVALQQTLFNSSALVDTLVASFSVTPDQLQAVLADDAFSVFALARIYNQGSWDDVFCNSTVFSFVYSFPPAVNSTAVQQAMCALNQTEFFIHASQVYNIDVLKLQSQLAVFYGYPDDFDWDRLVQFTEEIVTLMTELQKIPVFMQGDRIQNVTLLFETLQREVLQRNMMIVIQVLEEIRPYFQDDRIIVEIRDGFQASVNMFNMLNSFSAQGSLRMIEAELKRVNVWHYVKPFLDFANNLLDGVDRDLHPGGEAIPQFLYNRTVLDRFLKAALDTASPDFALAILLDRFYPISLLAYYHLSDYWEEDFCSPHYYDWFPSEWNGTTLRQELCHLDRMEFFGMLDNVTGVDVLSLQRSIFEIVNILPASNGTQQPFDWDALVGKVESAIAALQGFMGLPGLDNHGNMTDAVLLLQELQDGLLQFNMKLSIEILERLDVLMNKGGIWSEIQAQVAMATHFAQLWNQQMAFLAESNYTLEGVFNANAPAILSQFLAPEHVQALLGASIKPALLGALTQPQQLTAILCDTAQFNSFISLPPDTDADTIQATLCSLATINETFLQDLMGTFNIGKIQQEIERFLGVAAAPGNVTDIDWHQSFQEFELLVRNLMALPIGQDFLGDFFTQWLALSIPMENLPPSLTNLTSDYNTLCVSLPPALLNITAWQSVFEPVLTGMEVIQGLVFALPSHQHDLQVLLNNMTAVVELLSVFTEVQQSLVQSGTAVLFNYEQLSLAGDLILSLLQGTIGEGVVCEADVLKLVAGIPSSVNVTELSKLLCGVEKLLHTQAAQEVLRIVGFSEILPKINTLFSADPSLYEPFDCPAVVTSSQNFIESLLTLPSDYAEFINSFELPEYFDLLAVLPQVVGNTSPQDFQSLTELYRLLQPLIAPFLGDGNQGNDTYVDQLLPYLEMIDAYLISQLDQTEFVELRSLWSNTSAIRLYLSAIEGFSPDIIEAIVNNKLNSSALAQLQGNVRDQLCGDDLLFSQLFVFNDTAVGSQVQALVCKSLNSTNILGFLQGSLNVTELFRAITMTSPMVVTLPEYLDQLLLALEDFSALDAAVLDRFVTDQWPRLVDGLANTTDIVQLAMSATDLIRIAQSFQPLINVLQPVLGDDPTFKMIQELLDSLNNFDGLLDLISKLPDLSLSKLFKNPSEFQLFLIEDVGFSWQEASDLLSASLSLEVAGSANFSSLSNILCSEVELTKIIEFPKGTNVTGVLQTLCELDSQQLAAVLDGVVQRLNVGSLIKELLTYSLKEKLGNTTAFLGDLSSAATDLKPIQESIHAIRTEFQSLNLSFINVQDIVDSIMGNMAPYQTVSSVELMSKMFCGEEGSLFSLSVDVVRSMTSRTKRNVDELVRMKREEKFDEVPGSTEFCASFYKAIQTGQKGKLIWRYIKPILLGKIPYAPNNNATAKIIKESNFFFDEIATIRDVAKAWLNASGDLSKLIGSKQFSLIEDFLRNSYTKEILQDQLGLDSDLITTLLNSDLASISASDLQQLDQIAELIVNLTDCIDLDRFIPYRNEGVLEIIAERLSKNNTLFAGVYFSNLQGVETPPPHIKYKIRMDIEKTSMTDQIRDKDWNAGANNKLTDQLYARGFIILQDMIERGIIQSQTSSSVKKPGVYLQLMPYPCHVIDEFVERFAHLLPLMMTLVFMGALAAMTHQLVYEKELGIEELMKAMGLRGGLNLFSWFLNNLILMAIVSVLIVLILKLGAILPSSDWSLLFFFLMCFSFSIIMMCYLISTLFQKAHIAALAAVLIYLLTYVPYVLYAVLDTKVENFHRTFLFVISLISTCAFTIGCNDLALAEAQTVGVQWDAFAEGFHQTDEFGFNWKCLSMLWDGLLYFVIGLYISSVFPGRHGVPKPWYFIFHPWYWRRCFSCESTSSSDDAYARDNKTSDVGIDPANVPLGISIVGLTKKYKKKTAVDNLTLNFLEDEITSFLGRNGAGKTTTISIIMGLFPATAGKVFIHGQDVMKRLHNIRKNLGVCPQHDALYDQLTVREHLEMYGRLRGMSPKDIFQQSQDLIEDVGLQDAVDEKVCNLSGGMKRKLSVMIAFLGGSNVVILDEPTSGVDPHARRSIWDLIIKNKKGRTILLCTHFMDEADLLGDRIAILDHGQLRCCGPSASLKSRFTDGYTLTIAKELPGNNPIPEKNRRAEPEDYNRKRAVDNVYVEMSDMAPLAAEDVTSTSSGESSSGVSSFKEEFNCDKLTSLIQSHLPAAVFKEDVGTEVSYTLPVSFGQTAKFQALFNELDARLPELHASSYGISEATLEEVFLNVSNPVDGGADGAKKRAGIVPESTLKRTKITYDMKPSALRQFAAILTKRFHYTKRDWWGFIWGLLVPTLWILLAIAFGTIGTNATYPALHFAPSLYGPGDYVFFSNSDSETVQGSMMTNALFSEPGLGTTCMEDFDDRSSSCHFVEPFFSDPVSGLTSAQIEDTLATDRSAPACSCSKSFLECPEGAAGVPPPEWTMNTTDILLDVSLKVDLNKYLLRTTADFRFKRYNGLSFHSIKNSDGDTKEIVKAWYNNKGFHAMPTSLNTINNVILRSFLPEGQDPAKYGISAYNHPFQFTKEVLNIRDLWDQTALYFGICIVVVVAFSLIPATFTMFLVHEYNNGSKRLHYISGVTPAGYWLANLVWDMLMYLVPIGISLIIVYAFSMQAFGSATNMPAFCLLLFLYGFATACQLYLLVPLFKTTGTAFIVLFCLSFLIAVLTNIPDFLQESPLGGVIKDHSIFYYLDKIFLVFSPFCLASGLIDLLYNQVQADIFIKFGQDTYRDPFGYDLLGWKYVALAIEGAVAFILLMVIEYTCQFQCGDCISGSNDHHGDEDEDVATEKKRLISGDTKQDLVCIKNLTKVYRSVGNSSLVAVDDLCVGIPKGQCFGLLGVNGAGKTTTFRMIIKDLIPTRGSITVRSNSVGYCPQVDALYAQLTGTELLYCYAKIKGLTGKQCKMAVRSVTHQIGMQQFVDNRIGTYSGGMKRSLSTAIALLGNPQVVLMDEPTTGMDPVTKQAVWSNILAMIKNGHSVILTSHSMEECELLCTRLAIMVNGRFQCLGSPQQVKHHHGDGYTLILRISDEMQSISSVMNFVSGTFPDAVVKEKHQNMVRFQLSMTTRRLADIFGAVEENKARLGIQDYSVTQTTLDQVFVNFAKRQTDGHNGSKKTVQDYSNATFNPDEANMESEFL